MINLKVLSHINIVVDVFLQLPNTNFVIEMMEYHNPKGIKKIDSNKLTYQIGNVRRIALKVDNITPKEFEFFDDKLEQDLTIKQNVCNIVNQIKYFIFIDKYGIQWELEQGNTLMDL